MGVRVLAMVATVAALGLAVGSDLVACGGASPQPLSPRPPVSVAPVPAPPPPVDDAGIGDEAAAQIDAGPALPAVQTLVKGAHAARAIAVDRDAVYFIDETSGDVERIPKRGGTTMTIFSGAGGVVPGSSRIAVDASDIYWTSQVAQGPVKTGFVQRQDKNGGKPTTISTTAVMPSCVVLDGSSVFWAVSNAVMKAPKSGGPAVAIAGGLASPDAIAVDAKSVFVSVAGTEAKQYADGAIELIPKAGGAATLVVARATQATNVKVDDANVYWASGDKLMKAGKSGGAPTTLGQASGLVADLVPFDDGFVYFSAYRTDSDGTIARVSKDGGAVQLLASGQSKPTGIAVDPYEVFWTSLGTEAGKFGDSAVNKLAKPR